MKLILKVIASELGSLFLVCVFLASLFGAVKLSYHFFGDYAIVALVSLVFVLLEARIIYDRVQITKAQEARKE